MASTKKPRLLWYVIGLSLVPILFIVSLPRSLELDAVAIYLSALSAYMGTVLLLWMYMLGAKNFFRVFYHDLAPVLSIHKKLGKYGSVLYLVHPLLVMYAYGEGLLFVLLPRVNDELQRHITLGRIALMVLLVTWVLSALLRAKMPFRLWKYLHFLTYIALPFVLLHIPKLGSQFQTSGVTRGYYFVLLALFLLFSVIRLAALLNIGRRTYTVTSTEQLTPEDTIVVLAPVKYGFHIRHGQYVFLKLGLISEDHPFSVAYCNDDTGELTVVSRGVGAFTHELSLVQPGTKVSVAGPFGTFMEDLKISDVKPAIFIAGGIGVTPFVQRVIDESHVRAQLLFAVNRTHESAVLVPLMKEHLGPRCVAIYTRENPAGPEEETGHFSEEVLKKYVSSPTSYTYYVCGPKSFVASVRTVLDSVGIQDEFVKTEKFSW